MRNKLSLRNFAILILFIAVTLMIGLYGTTNRSKTDGGNGGISLQPPLFISVAEAAETGIMAFPADKAGISAYVKLPTPIDIDKVRTIFTGIEDVGDNYIIGIVRIPNEGGNTHNITLYKDRNKAKNTDVHLYADTDGWLVAYLAKEEPAAKIMKWPMGYYPGSSPPITRITTTTLQEALRKAGRAAGVGIPLLQIKYYDFRFPDATAMTLFVTVNRESQLVTQVKIPADYMLYEASYSACGLFLRVDGVSMFSSFMEWWVCNSYKGAIIEGVLHTITIGGPFGGALATVLIYEKAAEVTKEIEIAGADAVWTQTLSRASIPLWLTEPPLPVAKVEAPSGIPQTVLSQLEAERSKRWAVFIGINQYQDTKLSSLKYAVNDVKAVYSMLTDPQVGSFDTERVHLLTEDSEETPMLGEAVLKEPTFPNIWDSLNSVVKTAQPGDKVLIYFSGHGIEENNQTWLLASDSRLSMLDRTAIQLDEVNRILSECQADSKILILDACHSGAIKDKGGSGTMTSDFKNTAFTAITGRATLSSSGLNESSYDYDEKRHSAFTYFLLEGLKGEADSDADNIVSLTEISDYVKTEVPKWGFKSGKQQTPIFNSYITGEIILAGCSGQ